MKRISELKSIPALLLAFSLALTSCGRRTVNIDDELPELPPPVGAETSAPAVTAPVQAETQATTQAPMPAKDEPLLRRGIWYSYSEHGSCYYCFYGDKYKDSGCVISLEDGIITPFKYYVYSEAGDEDSNADEDDGTDEEYYGDEPEEESDETEDDDDVSEDDAPEEDEASDDGEGTEDGSEDEESGEDSTGEDDEEEEEEEYRYGENYKPDVVYIFNIGDAYKDTTIEAVIIDRDHIDFDVNRTYTEHLEYYADISYNQLAFYTNGELVDFAKHYYAKSIDRPNMAYVLDAKIKELPASELQITLTRMVTNRETEEIETVVCDSYTINRITAKGTDSKGNEVDISHLQNEPGV
ncbi:hypothetical protein [Ruminococcus sp. HUN007]|uniref:hypothetical protein n=1 Tax=Ruminococcus sp. HUN007 TaxID=1514668 RepID=UPI000679A022|nr:hypothetical protein [Ruminococcus sp. HUN007]